MITHIHTNIKYDVEQDVEPSEAISKVINKIDQNIKLVTQYNIRYGFSGLWTQYDGFYCNFMTNRHGMPINNIAQSTINQLMQGFDNLANQFPDYQEQIYFNSRRKAYQWYLDYLYKETGMPLYRH